jgi:hypothetical protein
MPDAPGLDTHVLDLFGFKGFEDSGADTEMDPRQVTEARNIDFDYGVISKRRGVTVVATFSGVTNLIYDFQSQQGFLNASDHLRTLVIAGTQLNVISNFPSGLNVDATFSVVSALHYAQTGKGGDCFISNENGGIPKLLFYHGGSWHYISAALDAPTIAPTLAVGGSTGSCSGDYVGEYTYQDLWGNETNPSPTSNTITVSSGGSVAAMVTASSDPSVIQINLYLLPPEGSLFQFVATGSNVTGTISWTGSDAELLEGAVAPFDHFPCPAGKYLAIYNSMLFVAGDPDVPDAVWVSQTDFLRTFAPTAFFRATSGDGQPARGFGHTYDQLILAKADSSFIIDGTDDLTVAAKIHNNEYGVLGQPSITQSRQKMVYFSDDGMYLDNGLNPTEISTKIRRYLRTLNPANLAATPPKQFAATYRYYHKCLFTAREAAGAGENDTILVWDYELDTWTRWKGNSARYLAAVQNADDYEYLYGGNAAGEIYQYTPPNGGSPNRDDLGGAGAAIDAGFKTIWLHLPKLTGADDWPLRRTNPSYLIIYAGGEPAGGNTTISLVTRYYLDFDEVTVQGTFVTNHKAVSWPARVYDPQVISNFGGRFGTFNWIKFEIYNNLIDEHFYIERLILGFKAKPPSRE